VCPGKVTLALSCAPKVPSVSLHGPEDSSPSIDRFGESVGDVIDIGPKCPKGPRACQRLPAQRGFLKKRQGSRCSVSRAKTVQDE